MGKKLGKMGRLASGAFLYEAQDFIAKYPQYIPDLQKAGIYSGSFVNKTHNGGFENLGHVLLIPSGKKLSGYMHQELPKKLVIIAEKYSYAKIYGKLIVNGDVNCFVKEGANLEFLHDIFHHIDLRVDLCVQFYLQASSKLHCILCMTGERDVKTDVRVSLLGENAEVQVKGFYVAGDKHTVDLKTFQEHRAAHTKSSVVIHGVLSGQAQMNYESIIFVDKNANGSQVLQKCKNIMCDKSSDETGKTRQQINRAAVQFMPQMEICNDEVTCWHGCATGQLDEAQIFYLQSRGLCRAEARKLLIEGFFDFLLNSLDNQTIKESLVKKIKIQMRRLV
ncbi:SufD family Fe-S cluster assembly protein [Candidatus Dependentiae bacterium]